MILKKTRKVQSHPPTLQPHARQTTLSIIALTCVSILAFLALIQPWSLRQPSLPLTVGDVATQDLSAPFDVQYVSNILTDAARNDAERAIAPVYVPPDPSIARTQAETLATVLASISAIRTETDKTVSDKQAELLTLQNLSLQQTSMDTLLSLSDARWELVQADAENVLEQVLKNPVRTEDLETIRQGLPALVSFNLSDREAELVTDLVSPLITANSFYSPELTDAARQAARAAVLPVTRSFVKGQTVVSRGQVISAVDLEALSELGLIKPKNPLYNLLGAAGLVVISGAFTGLYFLRRRSVVISDLRSLLLLSIIFIVILIGARVTIPNRTVIPYLFPIPVFALLVSALFGMESGMIFSLPMSALAAYGMPDALGLMPYYILSSVFGVLALGQARRLVHFVYAGIAIAFAGAAIVLAYRLPTAETDWIGLVTLVAAAIFMGIASTSLALPLQFILAQILGQTTALQLLEISRPDSPLLNYFLQRAPGTYQHSLQVANLAEQAAEYINADALLTRVGALFHDVGKAENPLFFVENQPPNQVDSHEELDPQESAKVIIHHITDGVNLIKRYRLPRRLADFILEHHGTQLTRYQYNLAVKAAGGDESKVNETAFRYPGPKPRSKETALLMLADGVEARSRAEHPATEEEMRELVRNVIDTRQKDGQLENVPLTQRDLSRIIESFATTMMVSYHPRLEYPREHPATADVDTQPREDRKKE